MEKLYNRIDFHNDTVPALNDANLNAMSKAIDDLDNRVINLPTLIGSEAVEICVEAAARAEEVAQSIPSDYSALSAEVQTKADKTQLSNKNLLSNGWFTVNQRGVTTYTAWQYGADRWKSDDSAVVGSNGITIPAGKRLYQIIEDATFESIKNKIVTLSILFSDGTIDSGTSVFDESGYKNIVSTDKVYGYKNGKEIGITAHNDNRTVRAVKLELGSISTLANDVAPNYAEELLKCQRYYYRLRSAIGRMYGVNTKALMTVELPMQMAKVPTLVLHPNNLNVFANGQTKDGTVSSIDSEVSMNDNQLRFFINFGAIGASASWFTPVIMQAESQYGYIEVSAEL